MPESKVGNVWHVEDSGSWQRIVCRTLAEDGHSVTTTPNATAARGMIPDGIAGIDVSILDGDLGDGTGAELAGLIRQSGLPIAIIGLSAGKTPWADTSLTKFSFDTDQLRESLQKLLDRQE
jgi:DNA-binding response OmpR family regulator